MASAGVPGLFPVAVDAYEVENPEYVGAVVLDSARQRWIVRCPRTQEASVRLESEHVILHSFTPGLRARLPFQLPTVVGSADRDGLRTFVYPEIPGEVVDIEELVRRSHVVSPEREPLSTQLGKALATIHTLPARTDNGRPTCYRFVLFVSTGARRAAHRRGDHDPERCGRGPHLCHRGR